ncbi:MAG TPA: FlxA-like family protein [Candidatus Saccharimonadales bacterium]|nr:FlxA-like family protein [Candidatus Saccharimonadales bacterium]
MKKLAALFLSLLLSTGAAFADSPKDSPKEADAQPAKTTPAAKPGTAKTNAEIAAEMEELRQVLQTQQEQLQMLKEELAKRDRQIEEARETAASANSRATEATVKANEAVATSAEVKTTATALNTSVANIAASNAAAVNASSAAVPGGQGGAEDKGPTTIRFKGINITPGGFIAAETVNRQRAMSSDINTPFNSLPFSNNATGKLPEMNFTGRQSRLSLLAETKLGETKVSGYYEADFLGTGVTSNNRQSNSYVFRQRQVWGRVDFASGWAFSAGQMWSLVTEDRKQTVNRTEVLPMVIDPQYVVGFNWERQYGARVSKTLGDKLTLAASVEGSSETLGGRGFSNYCATTIIGASACNSVTGTVSTNSFIFAPGSGGGLYNFADTTGYPINKTPDVIVKAAIDPGFGHYEVYGILSEFQNRVYPCAVASITAAQAAAVTNVSVTDANGNVYTGNYNANKFAAGSSPLTNPACSNTTPSASGAYNDSRTGGGVGFHAKAPVLNKKLDIGLSGLYGDGVGRYASGQLADVTLRPDGTAALIHNASWLGSLEFHLNPKWDIYGYVGGEYAGRAAYKGYQSVTGTNATTPVTFALTTSGGGTPPTSLLYPETQTTWKVSTSGVGGYGSPAATNTGCSTEVPPNIITLAGPFSGSQAGGSGVPNGGSSCAGDTRYLGEASIGFWNKLYQGEKGRVQWGIQYSYFYRNTWSGSGGLTGGASIAPHAVNNMVWTSFRYYLP